MAALLYLMLGLHFAMPRDVYYSSDSANFAYGINNYAPKNDMPHLPGYYLHVKAAKMINNFIGNKQQSLILLSLVYSLTGLVFLYGCLRKYGKSSMALAITMLIAVNPYNLFFSFTPEIYVFDLMFGSIILFYSSRSLTATLLVLALGSGFRPSSALLILPYCLYMIYRLGRDQNLKSVRLLLPLSLSLIAFLVWFIPMSNECGGVSTFLALFKSKQNQYPDLLTLKNAAGFFSSSITAFWSFGILFLFKIIFGRKTKSKITPNLLSERGILFAWIVPLMLFFLLIHMSKGYLMLLMPAVALIGIRSISSTKRNRLIIYSVVILQLLYFAFMPFRVPSDQVELADRARKESKASVWLERMASHYSMSHSQIVYYSELYADLKSAMIIVANQSGGIRHIIIDPSCIIKARSFPLIYRDYSFSIFQFRTNDSKLLSFHSKGETMREISSGDAECYILGSKSFVSNYIKDLTVEQHAFGYLTLYRIKTEAWSDYLKRIDYLFRK